jgi:hypothetical protein
MNMNTNMNDFILLLALKCASFGGIVGLMDEGFGWWRWMRDRFSEDELSDHEKMWLRLGRMRDVLYPVKVTYCESIFQKAIK